MPEHDGAYWGLSFVSLQKAMMYDFLILSHLPSFYKVNLYRALAQKYSVAIIYLGKTSKIRTLDFVDSDPSFKQYYLYDGHFEARPRLKTSKALLKHLGQLKYKKLILGGWEHPEFWWAAFKSPRKKNILCLESGLESQLKGPKAWLKRLFLSRITQILATGEPQVRLASHLRFKHTILQSQGVGLMNPPKAVRPDKPFEGRFLYVGRIAREKNIQILYEAFKKLPEFNLSLAGTGPLSLPSADNIEHLGHVPQGSISALYQAHDVLILPSFKEPWGLVVEEALAHGVPVLVSDKVGAKEWVESLQGGFLFDPERVESLMQAINKIADPKVYAQCQRRLNAQAMKDKDEIQLKVYDKALA